MKLESLTEAQLEKMQEVKQFWLEKMFAYKNVINKEKAMTAIEWLYKLAGYKKPITIFVDSPMACQYAAYYLKNVFNDGTIAQVWAQVWAQVGAQVRAQVWAQKMKFESFTGYWGGSVWDYGWVAFYDFFQQTGITKHEGLEQFKSLLLCGGYDMIQLNGFCIVSSMPVKIVRNNQNRLHNPTGPAIQFGDGYNLYFINGRAMPAWIFDKAAAGTITKESFLKEENSDIKGGIYEVLGQKKMMELLGAKEVDERQIVHKNGDIETVTLFKTEEVFAEIDNSPFAWVKMVCPSTGTQYLQGVEPHHTNALEAISSLSPFKPEEYTFDMRS